MAGGGLTLTTLLQGVLTGADLYGLRLGVSGAVIGGVVGVALNALLFTYLFRRVTVRDVGGRDVIVGAAMAAVAWFVLQQVGTSLVNQKVAGARGTYGTFAVVIGLLFWFALLAQITLFCAELNVVLARRLWPRSLASLVLAESRTKADEEAYRTYPQLERQVHNMDVDARVDHAE